MSTSPPSLLSLSLPDSSLKITYISPSGPHTPCPTTALVNLATNASLDDPDVAPGKLDLLFIPGPDPRIVPEESVCAWVRAHVQRGVELLTVCTGIYVAGYAGVLEGKVVSGPRGLAGVLREKFPGARVVDRRYVQDGKIWTSGEF